jgi:hypothetical protein
MVMIYLFFDDFLPPFLPPFFFAAIKLTTFHAVRDLPVAHSWQKAPDRSGKLWLRRSRGKG